MVDRHCTVRPVGFELGLHEVADGVWAYLQPDGSWGYSNAGLVSGEGVSLLVDTLFDLRLTALMLDAMAPHTAGRPIATVVNTHANGDHCHGNQLVAGAGIRVITSAATAKEMAELPATALAALQQLDIGEEGNRFVAEAFGAFDFEGIDVPPPTDTFEGMLTTDAGGRQVVLYEVGPAHTGGDIIAHLPDAGVVFAGDILFINGTPIVWAGPVANWLAACRRIRQLAPTVVVPGHGPLTNDAGVLEMEGYFEWLADETETRRADGMSALDAAWDIDLGPYAGWSDNERIVVNVDAVYHDLDPTHQRMNALAGMQEMGRYRAAKRKSGLGVGRGLPAGG
jgi:glyoxylase-like metal-dependent hydrolase (beta-lactamase superfamily II)